MALTKTGTRTGTRYWLIATAAVLWNAFGAMDFTLTAGRSPGYLAQVPREVIDWLDAAPIWTLVPWALGAWGGLVGSLLLLARSRLAVSAFAVSLAGLAVSQVWQLSAGMPPAMTTPPMIAVTVAIWIVALALPWFAWNKRREGVLR